MFKTCPFIKVGKKRTRLSIFALKFQQKRIPVKNKNNTNMRQDNKCDIKLSTFRKVKSKQKNENKNRIIMKINNTLQQANNVKQSNII